MADDRPTEHPFRERLVDAAIEAERQTGKHEDTVEQARRSLMKRLLRTVAGFLLIVIGLAGLVLPGPGWLIIMLGFSLLPYTWAQRTVVAIRRRVPGVPEDGKIPVSTWIMLGLFTVAVSAGSILWGDDLKEWLSARF